MAISLTDNIRIGQQKPIDDKYFNGYDPYISIAEANSLISIDVRHKGLTVNISGVEYWYKDGIEDEDLVLKSNNIDTSNLVPFTGADKDVKIGPHYFESDQGFKKTGGTETQALTATGGTYDLNNKADLVAGKVKADQIPSSSLSMDSSYVITFTDAAGGPPQTINLPIEFLFRDASYNSNSKVLTLTLDNEQTIDIPLTDLVDIPEIELSTSIPTVNPSEGKKVWFNTSSKKVWFNVGGSWVFGGNLISDDEKANLSTAYNHSQDTGNPHGTTKSDIGLGNVENTADLDKPISTATQNALNNKQNKLTNPITGSGTRTTDRIAKFTGNDTIGDSQIFENDSKIGIGVVPTSDKLEVDGNVKASGFKTSDNSANKALTSDGHTFDLSTKADLDENGKVKATQIPSSSLSMDDDYVITFVDASGGLPQTINLPIEFLFKGASYDPETRKLTLTLDNEQTLEISLADLVDIPEIVLSTDIPSVNPTEGKKVWFNTSSGKMWFNVGNVWVESPASDPKTTSRVVSTTTVGALSPGDFIDPGTTLQGLVEKLLDKTHYPTYVEPVHSLTNDVGNNPKEVGSTFNITLTFNFDKGKILGKLVNNVWQVNTKQDDKLGTATSYSINGSPNNPAKMPVTVSQLGTNALTGTVTYLEGPQPKDSKGNNFGSPAPGETSLPQSTTFEGVYPYFYYKSKSPISAIDMQNAILNGQATKVVGRSSGTFTIPPITGEYLAIAYPSTSPTRKVWYVSPLNSPPIPGGVLGGETILSCTSPTGLWSNVNYKIHVSFGLLTEPSTIELRP